MRKAQKQQAEDFLQTLALAHDEWKRLVEKNSASALEAARKILEDCQQGAIELGNMIEAAEGEGFPTISLLEAYCELTYQIHEALSGGIACDMTEQQEKQIAAGERERKVQDKVRGAVSSKRAAKTYKDLRKLLIQIENSVKHDIKVRTEAVFLPYKASMWDSLESVWRAAAEDESCDVYVIPIPYYDKNPDGSFREMHYEGHLYPDYVPVVWYENYDFANRQPDMIFIHNPYDNSNYVTSVHPFFYAQNLKQYTERLIYIPYFILDEIQPENDAAVGEMKHFCTTPAVIHADRVIVQSDDMRQIYINVMMEYTGNHDASRKYWEDKILGIGSPKVDKILYTRKEELKIPERWLKMILRPDGSWKKIIFYNTSINGLLQHNEQMLIKMQDTFRIFYENRNEVALLWRPHPLMESTLTSMRPQLWETYQKIRDQFIAEEWGIYDDTSDVDRAIVLSDGYFGDWSSVLNLYEKLKKPIMLQCAAILYHQSVIIDYLWAYSFALDEDCIWFVPYWYNKLYRYNLKKDQLEFCRTLPVFNNMESLYGNVVKCGERLVLVPSSADAVCIYNIKEDTFSILPLRDYYRGTDKFGISVTYGTYLYLFPFKYPAICKIDLSKRNVYYLTDWYEKFFFHNEGTMFQWSYYVYDSIVYLLVMGTNCIFQFDIVSETGELIPIGDSAMRYQTIDGIGRNSLYLSDQYGKIVLYDLKTKEVEVLESDIVQKNLYFICSKVVGNKIFYFPCEPGTCIEFDVLNKTFCELQTQELLKAGSKDARGYVRRFSQIEQKENDLYGFNTAERYFFKFNTVTNEVTTSFLTDTLQQCEKEELFCQFSNMDKQVPMELTTTYFNLKMFIEMMEKIQPVFQTDHQGDAGKRIYACIKSEVCGDEVFV